MLMKMIDELEHVAFHRAGDRNVVNYASRGLLSDHIRIYTLLNQPQVNHIFTQANTTRMWADRNTKPTTAVD